MQLIMSNHKKHVKKVLKNPTSIVFRGLILEEHKRNFRSHEKFLSLGKLPCNDCT